MIKAYWSSGQQWFIQRSRRERILIALSAVAITWLLCHHLWLQPARERLQITASQLEQQAAEAASLSNEIASLEVDLQRDPNAELRKQQAELQNRSARLRGRLDERAQLMPTQASVGWINALLDLPSGLELVTFDTAQPQPIVAPSEEMQGANVWRHGVEIIVRGQYHDIRNYIEGLERLSQPFYWQGLRYEVIDYPQAQVSIRVYALSTAQEFLGG